MRLILITTIILILTITSWQAYAQVKIDTVDISETVLEDRHLRYMYNFVLNNTFFQYKSGTGDFQDPFSIKKSKKRNIVSVINQRYPLRVNNLEYFIKLDSLKNSSLKYITNLSLNESDLVSQYDFIFVNIEFANREEYFWQVNQKVFDPLNSGFVVRFSDILILNNNIYLSISINYPVNYEPNIHYSNSQMYEFEWCESVGWVFPRRVTDSFFLHYHNPKGRLGGTIDIPSLKCYPIEK